ncbi:MAG: N-6 DNA methylase [Cytophagales bacterium]|nr:N-6 DNA methylase [Cytophagales bacterium]
MNKFSKRQSYKSAISLLNELLKENPSNAETESHRFNGFGAMKELLLPLDNRSAWTAEDLRYENEVLEFHRLLEAHFGTEYKSAVASLKNGTLSSFYTPSFIVEPLTTALRDNLENIQSILEPSAGIGNFISAIKTAFPESSITAIEKDHTTYKILKSSHPDVEAIHSGYENFKNRNFDLVVSNIPFGNISVYDDQMFREAVPAKIKATTRIHNYYFVKTLDNLKPGGTLAFITSNGLMDSPGNKEVREYLMKNADLVTAIRLPNNAFESAGTYPVTDIIILQKNTRKGNATASEKNFIESSKLNVPDEKGLSVEVDVSTYYKENPDNVLGTISAGGQYRGDSLDVVPKQNTDEEFIRDSLTSLINASFNGAKPTLRTLVLKPSFKTISIPTEA